MSFQGSYGNFHWSTYIFWCLNIKKLDMQPYGLTHIIFPNILYKFPLKAHIVVVLKTLFTKLYQGHCGLTHIDLSRILCKCYLALIYFLVLKVSWKIVYFHQKLLFATWNIFEIFYSRTIRVDLYFSPSKFRSKSHIVQSMLNFAMFLTNSDQETIQTIRFVPFYKVSSKAHTISYFKCI